MAKIHVIINTHRKPLSAVTTFTCLKAQESGLHEIEYTVAFDKEDHTSYRLTNMGMPVTFNIEPRPPSVATVWNRNLRPPVGHDVGAFDFYVPLPDDAFCATARWDDYIVGSFRQHNTGMMGWTDLANPDQITLPIITEAYRAAMDQPLFDTRFPFWFADTAIAETWSYATGRPAMLCQNLVMAGAPSAPNPTLRDMGMWWDFFVATRAERRSHGERMASRLKIDLPKAAIADLQKRFEARDERGRPGALAIEANMPLDRPGPTEHYLQAKAYAVAYLRGDAFK